MTRLKTPAAQRRKVTGKEIRESSKDSLRLYFEYLEGRRSYEDLQRSRGWWLSLWPLCRNRRVTKSRDS